MKRLLLLILILSFGVISCTATRDLSGGPTYDAGYQRAYTHEYKINGEYYRSTTVMHRHTDNNNCKTVVYGNDTHTVCE